jgi:hypothetical protein
MGAETRIIPIDPTIDVESRWGKTHGEARVRGHGRFLYVDISNRGIHRCKVIMLHPDGKQEVLKEAGGVRFCPLCDEVMWGAA